MKSVCFTQHLQAMTQSLWREYGQRKHENKIQFTTISPLLANHERASKCSYRIKASEHFVAGQINPDTETLLVCNNIYCRSDKDGLKGGEGGGYPALFELAINTALKNKEAARERKARSTDTRTTVSQMVTRAVKTRGTRTKST